MWGTERETEVQCPRVVRLWEVQHLRMSSTNPHQSTASCTYPPSLLLSDQAAEKKGHKFNFWCYFFPATHYDHHHSTRSLFDEFCLETA